MSFFDLQVNGYAGIDFNSEALTTEEARVACEAMREDGTTGALTTVNCSTKVEIRVVQGPAVAKAI